MGGCGGQPAGQKSRWCADLYGMERVFRRWDVDQSNCFPPAFVDLVPPDHLIHFIRRVVAEDLDVSGIYAGFSSTKGQPPYHPGLMTALLLYGYSRGVSPGSPRAGPPRESALAAQVGRAGGR